MSLWNQKSERKERQDGPHVPKQSRGEPECDLPPCCRVNLGYPVGLSPFIQVRLPKGYSYMNKESRAMSFRESEGQVVPRGTQRTYAMAVKAVESWAWQWFESLSPAVQKSMSSTDKEILERPTKKQKT